MLEHCDTGFADREARGGDDRLQQALEALAGLGQLGRDARRPGMHFCADVVRDETDDALAVGGGKMLARVSKPDADTIHPKAAVGLSMISTTAGSVSKPAIVGPNAVRSIPAPRAKVSERSGARVTCIPDGDGDEQRSAYRWRINRRV